MVEAGLKILEASGRLETTYLAGSDEILVRRTFVAMSQVARRDTQKL
jgi:hypothetical protein